LKQLREKSAVTVRDVESLCFWSERLLQAEMWTSTLRARELPAGTNRAAMITQLLDNAFQAHAARLEQVAKATHARARSGEADPVTAAAVESLVLLAEWQRAAFLEAQQLEAERELDIVLPDASEARPLTSKPRELFVSVDAQERYYVGGKCVELDELKSTMKTAADSEPGRVSIIIRADRKVPFQAVARLLNACEQAGIHDYRVTLSDGKPED
jgi:biopolymer transport protein ExbD